MTTDRITWQNVAAPDFGAAGLLMGSASQLVGKAFDGFNSLMSDRAKQQADNLIKTQDYWTKMAGIPIQRLGVDDATTMSMLDPMMALSKLGGLPTDDKSIFDIPAIAGLLAARVPKAREEASATIDWQNKQAGIAEAPLLTVATETMLKDPARAFTNMSALLNTPEMAGLRPATRSQLLKDAYTTTTSAKQAELTNKKERLSIREKQISIDSAVAAQREKDLAAKLKNASDFVRTSALARSNGLLQFDATGKLVLPRDTSTLLTDIRKSQGENSNIGNTVGSWYTYFDPTDTNTHEAAELLDKGIQIKFRDASGNIQTFTAHIPEATKVNMLIKHASIGKESGLKDDATWLYDGLNTYFNPSTSDPVAELIKAGYDKDKLSKIAENAAAMMEEVNYSRMQEVMNAAVLNNTDVGTTMIKTYQEIDAARRAAIQAEQEKSKKKTPPPAETGRALWNKYRRSGQLID